MMNNVSKIVSAFLSGLLLLSCDPTRFSLSSERSLDCRILSDHHLVQHSGNGFTISPLGTVEVTYPYATQYRAIFYVTLNDGDGLRMLIHPVVQEQVVDSGVVLTLTKNGYQLRAGDSLVAAATIPTLPVGKQMILRTYSDEGYLEITLGCDTLYKGISLRQESDDFVFSALAGSTVRVVNPFWRDLEIVTVEQTHTIIK